MATKSNVVVLAHTKDLTEQEWLAYRRKGIGGSEAAAVAGLDQYKSRHEVWKDKTDPNPPVPHEMSEAAYWGHVHEETVAREFTIRTGKRVRRDFNMYVHQEHQWMLGNLDRVVIGENAGLECKTASEYLLDDWAGNSVPFKYYLQCQHYISVRNFDKMYLAVLIGGNKFVFKEVFRDEEVIDYLIEIQKDFWLNHVETGIEPAPDGTETCTAYLRDKFPEHVPAKSINLEDQAEAWIKQRDENRKIIKDAEVKVQEAMNHLMNMMGDSEVGYVAGAPRITWKNDRKFDEQLFAKENPDLAKQFSLKLDKDAIKKHDKQLYDKYMFQNGTRKFIVKDIKEG